MPRVALLPLPVAMGDVHFRTATAAGKKKFRASVAILVLACGLGFAAASATVLCMPGYVCHCRVPCRPSATVLYSTAHGVQPSTVLNSSVTVLQLLIFSTTATGSGSTRTSAVLYSTY